MYLLLFLRQVNKLFQALCSKMQSESLNVVFCFGFMVVVCASILCCFLKNVCVCVCLCCGCGPSACSPFTIKTQEAVI